MSAPAAAGGRAYVSWAAAIHVTRSLEAAIGHRTACGVMIPPPGRDGIGFYGPEQSRTLRAHPHFCRRCRRSHA